MASPLFDDRYAEVVAVLIAVRKEAALTQTELAQRLGRPQSYISKVERRERRVDPAEFHDWCRAAGLDPDVMFKRVSSKLGRA